MLKAHPRVLRDLLAQYEALRDAVDSADSRRLDDVSYTLCILTGMRHIDAAVTEARRDIGVRDGTAPGQ